MLFAASSQSKDLKAEFERSVSRLVATNTDHVNERLDGISCQLRDILDMMQTLHSQMQSVETACFNQTRNGFRSQGSTNDLAAKLSARGTRDLAPVPGRPHGIEPALGNNHEATARSSHAEIIPLLSDRDDYDEEAQLKRQQMTFQEKLAVAREGLQAGKVKQPPWKKAITDFLEDPESSRAATNYKVFITLFSVFAIIIALLQTVDIHLPSPHQDRLNIATDALLFLEVVMRFISCPSYYGFLANPMNIIDLCSALPLAIIVIAERSDDQVRTVAEHVLRIVVPVVRLLRMVRRFPYMKLLTSAFASCLEALPVLLYTMAVMGCVFSSLIFTAETRDSFPTMAHSAWFVLSTMTTVGYGDITPETQTGAFLTSLLMIVSSLYMAMPVAIIGYSFTQIWGNRVQILLLHSTRDRLLKWGFGAYEIPKLFRLFDLDDSAEIDLEEFQRLLQEMQIGFKDNDIVELFKVIDKDSGGSIDTREFVKTLYPDEYRVMYGKRERATDL